MHLDLINFVKTKPKKVTFELNNLGLENNSDSEFDDQTYQTADEIAADDETVINESDNAERTAILNCDNG